MKAYLKFYFFVLLVSSLIGVNNGAGQNFHCDVPDDWLHTNSLAPGARWPNGTVVYQFDSSTLTPQDIVEIRKAFYDIQNKTCIRFRPRENEERAYVSLERDDNICGVAHLCRTGGYQFAKFGRGCNTANVMVHELGHTLCLGHEQTRIDRDDFVHFDSCQPGQIPSKNFYETRGHFYDYTSQMHYQCRWCAGGWPKMEDVPGCGMDVQAGMSNLDADKVNDFYDCQGCFRHRWRRIESLSDEDKSNMISFGVTNDGQPLYLCRAYTSNAEVAPGKYRLDQGICYIPSKGVVHQVRSAVQVFVDPQRNSGSGKYRALQRTDDVASFTRVGRTSRGESIYAAVSSIELGGTRERAIGKVYGNNMTHAYIPSQNNTEVVVTQFEIIGCA